MISRGGQYKPTVAFTNEFQHPFANETGALTLHKGGQCSVQLGRLTVCALPLFTIPRVTFEENAGIQFLQLGGTEHLDLDTNSTFSFASISSAGPTLG